MRDLCYVTSKRAQRQLKISDGRVANEPKEQPRAFFILKAPFIFTSVPSCPAQRGTRSPSPVEAGERPPLHRELCPYRSCWSCPPRLTPWGSLCPPRLTP